MTTIDFQLGDHVAANAGGREMTVSKVSIDVATGAASVECGWFENGIPQTSQFAPSELRHVSAIDVRA